MLSLSCGFRPNVALLVVLSASACGDTRLEAGAPSSELVPSPVPQPVCDLYSARMLARAYGLSLPLVVMDRVLREAPGRTDLLVLDDPHPVFRSWVQENASALTRSGSVVSCARNFGPALARQGVSMYDAQAHDRVVNRFGGEDLPPEIYQDVGDSMNQSSLQMFAAGLELDWLGRVLPAAAQGDWGPYLQTGTDSRLAARQATVFLRAMMGELELAQYLRQTQGYYPDAQKLIEEQVVLLALIYAAR